MRKPREAALAGGDRRFCGRRCADTPCSRQRRRSRRPRDRARRRSPRRRRRRTSRRCRRASCRDRGRARSAATSRAARARALAHRPGAEAERGHARAVGKRHRRQSADGRSSCREDTGAMPVPCTARRIMRCARRVDQCDPAMPARCRSTRSARSAPSSAAPARTTAPTPARCWSPSRTGARSRSAARPTIRRPPARCAPRSRATSSAPTRTERVLHPMRRVGRKGEGRFERISWDEALDDDRRAVRRDRGVARRPAGDRALQLRGHDGPPAVRLDGPPLLPSARRVAARPHDLRDGRQGRLGRDDRRGDRHGRRAVREQPADPDLGQQLDRVQPALLDARAGGEAARREADRHRSLPQRDRREVPRAHRAAARHRRRAGARHDARADRRGPGRPRLHRALHARLRRAARRAPRE